MSVKSDQLPLLLSRSISEQPSADNLYFNLDRPLGELPSVAVVTVTSSTLPLPLTRPISEQPPANQLPFYLTRKLGTLAGSVTSDDPIEPPPPTEPRRTIGIMSCLLVNTSPAVTISSDLEHHTNSVPIAAAQRIDELKATTVANCQSISTIALIPLANCQSISTPATLTLQHKLDVHIERFIALSRCQSVIDRAVVNRAGYTDINSAAVVGLKHCIKPLAAAIVGLKHSVNYQSFAVAIAAQQLVLSPKAVPVPCRYYPIPEPPPTKPSNFVCRLRPPSNQLPFNLTRKRGQIPSSNLPLPLMCWHDELPPIIPNLRMYIMHHTITATVGGIAVNPLDFGFKSDMAGPYWQGDIEISPHDWDRIKHIVEVDVGLEPLVHVIVNGESFAFIGETPIRKRSFANHTHSLEGRSVTARLGADYATPNNRLFNVDNYASQMMRQQLQDLPYTLEFDSDVDDWLIPANTYSIANKTPIAAIAEIAAAAGAYVASHQSEPILMIKKRWPVPAWEIAAATPTVTIPAVLIIGDSTRTNKNPRYNSVWLAGNTFLDHIYRETQGRDVEAPAQKSALYTDQKATIAQGKAILSDSGTHAVYPIKLPWSNDVLPLAQKGQIWQVNDTDGTWRGLVIGIDPKIDVVNGAPEPYQTVTLDRYLDN